MTLVFFLTGFTGLLFLTGLTGFDRLTGLGRDAFKRKLVNLFNLVNPV
jgi:hypothetical protein